MATMEKIRTEQPVKNTVHNLVQTLSIKLDSASRYTIYQEDAKKDGFDDCAKVWGRLAGQEQEMIDELVTCLEKHIGEAR
jgi:rubrerythrin